MPPFILRKRGSPPTPSQVVPSKRARLGDVLDAESTNRAPNLVKRRTFSVGDEESSDESSLSEVDGDQFQDIDIGHTAKSHLRQSTSEGDEEGQDESDIEWEDAGGMSANPKAHPKPITTNGPIEINLRKGDENIIDYGTASRANSGKKGPSKREKQVRILTHQLHVQLLLWHNAIRNSWIGDQTTQEILVKQLPPQICREVEKWKRASGLVLPDKAFQPKSKNHKKKKSRKDDVRSQRDWGQPSQRLEAGKADMSQGDPLIMLLRVLSAYWKKRFAVTVPGLRKRGYGTKLQLRQTIASWKHDEHDPEIHGEKITGLPHFREIARQSEGSRDVGAQLFTALLRGLGIEARLVCSLQPSGYGWTKTEQMLPEKSMKTENYETGSMLAESKSEKTKYRPAKTGIRKKVVINLDSEDQGGDNDSDSGEEPSIVDMTEPMLKQRKPMYDRDLMFPIYWTEAISPVTSKVVPVSPLVLETPVTLTPESLYQFEPRGIKAEKGRQVLAYVVAYSPDGTAKDVTVRYLRKQVWPGKTRGVRFSTGQGPFQSKSKGQQNHDWFQNLLRPYTRNDSKRTTVDDIEDTTDLVPREAKTKGEDDQVDTLQSLKTSADFVLERFLRREEALKSDAKPVRTFASGKGDAYKEEQVYRRADVERCLTAESWHKEGRRPKAGEAPMKMVPVRAVTLTRKREAEEHERQYGEKQLQGLYSWDQTEWIIPPAIQNGVIPKNAYGNMDCFVPSMVPQGAVHVPLRGTVRVCKRLNIDYAEAVTGFEFGNKRAVPVCTGVVVAEENAQMVRDAWEEWNEEQRRKEDAKNEKLVLDLWRKFVLGLRIRERVQDMYGEDLVFENDISTGLTKEDAISIADEDGDDVASQGGGFLPGDDFADDDLQGGFLPPDDEDAAAVEDLVMEDLQPAHTPSKDTIEHYPTPSSLATKHQEQQAGGPHSSSIFDDETSALEESESSMESYPVSAVPKLLPVKPKTSQTQGPSTTQRSRRGGYKGRGHDTVLSENVSREDSGGEDEDEVEEQYVPRSTRTRQIKASIVHTDPKSLLKIDIKPNPQQNSPKLKNMTKTKSQASQTCKATTLRSGTNHQSSAPEEVTEQISKRGAKKRHTGRKSHHFK